MRDMIFISHASEDSDFTRWLALQLAKEGYGVWCDLTKLLGGENWPQEINEALQTKTQKFLFVLSSISNKKLDPLNELEVARGVVKKAGLKNFIIPLKIDNLAFDETDFRLQSYQAISFRDNWARGLAQLLKALNRDKVEKNNRFSPDAVSNWWRQNITGSETLRQTSETLQSNRFRILSYPEIIYAHHVGQNVTIRGDFSFPFFLFKEYLISFSSYDELDEDLLSQVVITESHPIEISGLVTGKHPLVKSPGQGDYILSRLMNQSLSKGLMTKGFRYYNLSKSRCFYFDNMTLPGKKIKYTNAGELDQRLVLWGKHYADTWHFGVVGNFVRLPVPHFSIHPSVLLKTKGNIRPAPRSVYKRWYNQTWRNRIRASMIHLAEGLGELSFSVGRDKHVRLKSLSDEFLMPISYQEPEKLGRRNQMI